MEIASNPSNPFHGQHRALFQTLPTDSDEHKCSAQVARWGGNYPSRVGCLFWSRAICVHHISVQPPLLSRPSYPLGRTYVQTQWSSFHNSSRSPHVRHAGPVSFLESPCMYDFHTKSAGEPWTRQGPSRIMNDDGNCSMNGPCNDATMRTGLQGIFQGMRNSGPSGIC